MNAAELAHHNAADRVRVLAAAIRETQRGIAIRQAGGACTVRPQLVNLARLMREHAEAVAHLTELTA